MNIFRRAFNQFTGSDPAPAQRGGPPTNQPLSDKPQVHTNAQGGISLPTPQLSEFEQKFGTPKWFGAGSYFRGGRFHHGEGVEIPRSLIQFVVTEDQKRNGPFLTDSERELIAKNHEIQQLAVGQKNELNFFSMNRRLREAQQKAGLALAADPTIVVPGRQAIIDSTISGRQALEGVIADVCKDVFPIIDRICDRLTETAQSLALARLKEEQAFNGSEFEHAFQPTPRLKAMVFLGLTYFKNCIRSYHLVGRFMVPHPDKIEELWLPQVRPVAPPPEPRIPVDLSKREHDEMLAKEKEARAARLTELNAMLDKVRKNATPPTGAWAQERPKEDK